MLENVPDSAIIGMLISFKRKGKEYQTTEWGYRLYVRLWHVVFSPPAGSFCALLPPGRTCRPQNGSAAGHQKLLRRV